jgi:hypothetical protein
MASIRMTMTCPHCGEGVELRMEMQGALVPHLKLQFATVEEFATWLKASRLSVDEFRRMPAYEWHRDQLEPFVRTVADRAEDETAADEWNQDQLGPLTRAGVAEAEEEAAHAASGLDRPSDAPNL